MIPDLNTLEEQVGKKGRPFRNTAIQIVPNTTKWINGTEKNHYLHIFKYIDDGSLFAIEIDYNGEIVEVIKHYEYE